MSSLYYTTSNTAATMTNTILYSGGYTANPWWQPTVYVQSPSVVLGPPIAEAAAIPETDMAWLRRRVDEISWVPA